MARAVMLMLYAFPLVLALLMLFTAAVRSFQARRLRQPQESVRRAQMLEYYLKRQLLWNRVGQEVERKIEEEGKLPEAPVAYVPAPHDELKALLRKKYALQLLMARKKAEHVTEMEVLGGSLQLLDRALHGRSDAEFEEAFAAEGLTIPEEYS